MAQPLATCIPRRPLRRVPRRALPSGAGRARGRVLHPCRVERRTPALLVVAREVKVVALARHAHGDVPNPGPRAQQGTQGVASTDIRGHGAPGESEGSTEKLAAWVEHATG